jgi:hypothetical protein
MNEKTNLKEASDNDTSTELTLRDILHLNQFKENDSLLDNEISELESLYKMSKAILIEESEVSNSSTTSNRRLGTVDTVKRKNFMFISNQTANLISLRKLKLDLVKQKADLKRDELDRSIKAIVQISKEENSSEENDNPKRILDYLVNNLNINIPINAMSTLHNEQDMDDLLELALKENNIIEEVKVIDTKKTKSKPKEVYKKTYLDTGNYLVYDANEEKLYLVNDDYEVINELSEDEYNAEMIDDQLIDTETNTIIELLE